MYRPRGTYNSCSSLFFNLFVISPTCPQMEIPSGAPIYKTDKRIILWV